MRLDRPFPGYKTLLSRREINPGFVIAQAESAAGFGAIRVYHQNTDLFGTLTQVNPAHFSIGSILKRGYTFNLITGRCGLVLVKGNNIVALLAAHLKTTEFILVNC